MWTRRQCLTGLAALGMQSLGSRSAGAEKPSSVTGTIDAHVHIWTPDLLAYPRSGPDKDAVYKPDSFTPDELFANSKPSGVNRVVLIQMIFYGYDNSYMLRAIAKYRATFRGVAIVDAAKPNVETEMKELSEQGIRGFRIVSGKRSPNWLDSSGMHAMWKSAVNYGQAMCALVDPEALQSLDKMCSAYPDTTVVIDHLARIGMDEPIREADVSALCRMARHPHVYVKASAFYALGQKRYPYLDLSDLIHHVYDAYGAQRVMWGSDSPFQEQTGNTYAGSIQLVRDKLNFLSNNDREWILRKTAEQVFFS